MTRALLESEGPMELVDYDPFANGELARVVASTEPQREIWLADQLGRMRQAMVARCHDPRWLWQARPIAASAGALFVRSYERGERIHQAMLARGFTGSMPDLDDRHATAGDWLAALAPAALATIALVVAVVG